MLNHRPATSHEWFAAHRGQPSEVTVFDRARDRVVPGVVGAREERGWTREQQLRAHREGDDRGCRRRGETRGAATRVGRSSCGESVNSRGLRRLVGAAEAGPVIVEVVRAVHQRHVGERLREVAEHALRRRVVLLGEQPDVVGEPEQALEQRARLVDRARACTGCRRARTSRGGTRPRRAAARRRRPRTRSAATKPSTSSSRWIASTVPTTRGSVAGRKPDERDHQRARVERLRAVVLREGVALGVEALLAHLRWISSRAGPPPVDRPVEPELLDRPSPRGRTRPTPSPWSG